MSRRVFPMVIGQRGLATSRQLRDAGWSGDAIRHAQQRTIRKVYPGVFAGHRGPLDPAGRLVAAHLWAGESAVLSGRVALQRLGLDVPSYGTCVFLVPATCRARRVDGVRTIRTTRELVVTTYRDGVPLTTMARALCDAASYQDLGGDQLRAATLSALQRRLTHLDRIAAELGSRPSNGLGPVRAACREFSRGAWSVPEGRLATLVRSGADLPDYLLNPVLETVDGQRIGCPDGYFASVGVAVQVHSQEFHSGWSADGRDRWSTTVEKDAAYVEHDVVVVPITPASITHRPATVLDRLRRVIAAQRCRDVSHIVVIPADSVSRGRPA